MKKIILFLGFLFLAGCGAIAQNEVEQKGRAYIDDYPMNKQAVVESIRTHRVIYGMTTNEVLTSWGAPLNKHEIKISEKYYTVWVYKRNSDTILLYFRNDLLEDIQS